MKKYSVDDKSAKSLEYSILDGAFASVMTGFTQDYFIPFLLLLNATVRQVGMLSAFPNLFAALVQLKTPGFVERFKSRKKVINIFVFLQAFMLLPMALIAAIGKARPEMFILLVVLFTSFGAIALPAWGSLMSDLVAGHKRGAYFGWRTRTVGFLTVGAAFTAGVILAVMKKVNVFYGFIILFMVAFLFRLISWYFLKKMHEPHLDIKKEHYFSLIDFIKQIRKSNFAKFVFFVSLMNFSVNMASPFFSVFMLRDLKFSYIQYTVVTVSATLTIFLMISRWGRHADKVGNLRIIRFTAPFIGLIPLLWIFNQTPIYLIMAQVFSGFMWAGFNISSTNFVYDAVTPEKRTRCIAYFNLINGTALCMGALIGGFMIKWLPPVFGYKMLALFIFSSFMRFMIGAIMPLKLKEVRPVENISNNSLFFSIIGVRPMLGMDKKM